VVFRNNPHTLHQYRNRIISRPQQFLFFSATNSCDLCKISNSDFGMFSQIMRFYTFFLDNLHQKMV